MKMVTIFLYSIFFKLWVFGLNYFFFEISGGLNVAAIIILFFILFCFCISFLGILIDYFLRFHCAKINYIFWLALEMFSFFFYYYRNLIITLAFLNLFSDLNLEQFFDSPFISLNNDASGILLKELVEIDYTVLYMWGEKTKVAAAAVVAVTTGTVVYRSGIREGRLSYENEMLREQARNQENPPNLLIRKDVIKCSFFTYSSEVHGTIDPSTGRLVGPQNRTWVEWWYGPPSK